MPASTRSSTAACGGPTTRSATGRTRTTRPSPTGSRTAASGSIPTIGEVELHEAHDAAGGPALPAFEHWALPDVPSELEPRLGFMRDMADRGVRFIGGMGMGMPIVTFDSVACSAQVYARLLGFDPWRAIRTITCDAAEALGLAGVTGAIRPGLAADLVAVEGDPIAGADGPGGHAGLGGLRRVRDVIQGGRPVVRDGQALV